MAIAYDGSRYSGWQVQPNALTIQEVIQKALSRILKEPMYVIASGRTDAGVHALEQIAHFRIPYSIDAASLRYQLNALLPKDISCLALERVDNDFHARFSAQSKCYRYYLHTDPYTDPFLHPYRTHIRYPIDTARLTQAASHFVGEHDFTSFANKAGAGSAANGAIRTVYSLDIEPIEGGLCLAFHGNGFLYKMVRNITGTLLRVASHKLPIEAIPTIFEAKDRRKAPMAAPAHGLFLCKVYY